MINIDLLKMIKYYDKRDNKLYNVDVIDFSGNTIRKGNPSIQTDNEGCIDLYDKNVELIFCTGKKDMNHVLIYEGDVFCRNGHFGYVKWNQKKIRFEIIFEDEKVLNFPKDKKWKWNVRDNEIIGSIYKNFDFNIFKGLYK